MSRFWVCRSTDWSLLTHFAEAVWYEELDRLKPTPLHKRETMCRELHSPALKTDPTYSRCTLLHLPEIQDHLAVFRPPPGTIFSANISLFLLLLQDPLHFLHCGWLAEEKALDPAQCTLSGKVEHFSAFFFFFFSRQQTSGVQRLSERGKENLPRLLFATCVRKYYNQEFVQDSVIHVSTPTPSVPPAHPIVHTPALMDCCWIPSSSSSSWDRGSPVGFH